MKVLVYRKCSTCQKALKWLDAHGISFEERAMVEEHPTYEELKEYITNVYYVLMTRGIKGTYLYVCDDELREYFSKYIEEEN